MHVAFAIDNLGSGGAQSQSVKLALYLAEQGLRIQFVTYGEANFFGHHLQEAGIPVTRVVRCGRFDPGFPLRVGRWLRAEQPDLLHAFLSAPSFWYYLGVRTLGPDRRPVFVAGERSSLADGSRLRGHLCGYVYPRADAVTVNAEPMHDQVASAFHVASDRIHYLPNGIDLVRWDREAREPCPLVLESGRFHLALVGGLRREKNHLLLLEALARLRPERIRDWRVWLVGGETGRAGDAERVRRAVTRFRLDEVVRIVPPVRQIAAMMARLHGLVLPSSYEGFPNVVLEAMASRLPVVVSPVGDVPNLVEHRRTGFILKQIEASELAGQLEALYVLSSEERRRMGERARQVVEARFSMPTVAGKHLELYYRLTSARSTSS